MLVCSKCKLTKHITEFYTQHGVYVVLEEQDHAGNTYAAGYGKPLSWCKECMKVQRERRAVEAELRQAAFARDQASKVMHRLLPEGDDVTQRPWWNNPHEKLD